MKIQRLRRIAIYVISVLFHNKDVDYVVIDG